MKRKRGFTLIELIVVILILAILAALIVPKLVGRTDDAKVATAKTNIASLHSLLEQFRLDCDRYPTTQEGLDALLQQPANVKNWHGPYIDRGKLNDPWDNPYVYEYPNPNGNSAYLLMSYGADGAPGGEGPAEDIIDGQEK